MSNLQQYLERKTKLAGASLATLFAPQNLDEEGNRLIQEEFAKLPSNFQGAIRSVPLGGLQQLGQTKLTPESVRQAQTFTEGTKKVEVQKEYAKVKQDSTKNIVADYDKAQGILQKSKELINNATDLSPEEKADLLNDISIKESEYSNLPNQIAEDNPYISPFQIKDLQNKIQKKSGIETLIPALEQPLQAFAGAGDFVNSAFATVEGVLNAPWGIGGEIEKFGRNEQARQLQQVSNRLNQNVSAEERNSLLKTKTYLEAQLAAPQKFATIGDAYTQGAQESFNFDKKIENEINKSTIAGTPIRQALDVDQGAGSQAARFLGSTALYALNPIKLPVPAGLAARTGGNLVLNLLKAGGAEAIEDALLNGLVSEGDVQKGILEGTIDPKDLNTERLKAFALNTVTDVMGGAALKGAGQLLGKGIKQVGEIPQQQVRANTAKAIRENLPEARFNQRFNAIAEATEKDIPELEQKINSLADTTPRKAELIESLNEKKLAIEEQKKLQADSEVVEVENKYKALTEIEQGTRITPSKRILETKKNQIDLDIKDPEDFNSPEALEALNKKKEFVQSKLDEIETKNTEKQLELTKRREEIFQKKTDKEIANASKKEKAKISDNLRKSTDLGYVDSYKDAVYLTKDQKLIDQFENRRYELITNSTNESIKKQKEGIKNHFSVINGINKTDKLEGYKTFIEDEDLTPVQKTMLTDHIDQRINDIEEKKAIRERLGESQGQATTEPTVKEAQLDSPTIRESQTVQTPRNQAELEQTYKTTFGLDEPKAKAAAVVTDRIFDTIARRKGITKEAAYAEVSFRKSNLNEVGKGAKFQGKEDALTKLTQRASAKEAEISNLEREVKRLDEEFEQAFEKKQEASKSGNKQEYKTWEKEQNTRLASSREANKALRAAKEELEKTQKEIEQFKNTTFYSLKPQKEYSLEVDDVYRSKSRGKVPGERSKSTYLQIDSNSLAANTQIPKHIKQKLQKKGQIAFSDHYNGKYSDYFEYIESTGRDPLIPFKFSENFYNKVGVKVLDDLWIDGQGNAFFNKRKPSEASMKAIVKDGRLVQAMMEADKKFNLDQFREPDIRFQSEKGAMETLESGKKVIHALTDPNVSTPLHEVAHVYEEVLTKGERNTILEWAGSKEWDTNASEKFARGFERYLAEGKAPIPALKEIFEDFKDWLLDIYKGITGSDIDLKLNKQMRKIYDEMLSSEPSPIKEKLEENPDLKFYETKSNKATLETGERKLSKTVQEGGALNVLAKELADDFSKSPDAFYSVSKQNNFIEASNKIVEKMERNELFAKAQDLSAKALGDTRMNDAEIIELGAYVKHFALNDPDSPFTQNLLRGFRNQASESGKALVAFNNLILKNSDIDIEMRKQKRISEELGIDEKIQRKMIEKDNKFMSEIIDTDFDVFDC